MKRVYLIILASFFLFSACTITPIPPDRSTDEAMLNFLPYLNQKVAGYLDANNIRSLDTKTYRGIVDKVCSPLPSCGKNATIMFNTYDVQPRMLNSMFSVMLCNKDKMIKVMEDFSCNEQKVEIPTFQIDPKARCVFEDQWKEKIALDCPGIQ
jgi:hypothetical protein